MLQQTWVTKENWRFRLIQGAIFIAHMVLLKWILFALAEGGIMPFKTVLMHFAGISAYGAILIRTCAYIYHRKYQQELAAAGKPPYES